MIIYLCPATKPGAVTLMAEPATWDAIQAVIEATDLARFTVMQQTPRKPSGTRMERMTFTADMARYVQEIARSTP
jgi:hypothetical protein